MAFSLPIPNRGPIVPNDYKIKPHQIVIKNLGSGIFGDNETAKTARVVMTLAQQNGDWCPLSPETIESFYEEVNREKRRFVGPFLFNALITPRLRIKGVGKDGRLVPFGGGWMVEINGKLHFTEGLIEACHKVSQRFFTPIITSVAQ